MKAAQFVDSESGQAGHCYLFPFLSSNERKGYSARGARVMGRSVRRVGNWLS